MTAIFGHFLKRLCPKWVALMSAAAALLLFAHGSLRRVASDVPPGTTGFLATSFDAWIMLSLGGTAAALILGLNFWMLPEYDLVLPFDRRAIFGARVCTNLTVIGLGALPLALAFALSPPGHVGGAGPTRLLNFVACLPALYMLTVLLWPLLRPLPLAVAALPWLLHVTLTVALPGWVLTSGGESPGLVPAVSSLVAAPILFLLARRVFCRFEFLQGTPAGLTPFLRRVAAGQTAVHRVRARSHARGVVDRMPPLLRAATRALWARWWHLLVFVVAGLSALALSVSFFASDFRPTSFVIFVAACGVFWTSGVLQRLSLALQLPLHRRWIFRAITFPMVAACLLGGGIGVAMAPRTVDRIRVVRLSADTIWVVHGGFLSSELHVSAVRGDSGEQIAQRVAEGVRRLYGVRVAPRKILATYPYSEARALLAQDGVVGPIDPPGKPAQFAIVDNMDVLPRLGRAARLQAGVALMVGVAILVLGLWVAIPGRSRYRSGRRPGRALQASLAVFWLAVSVALLVEVLFDVALSPITPGVRAWLTANAWPVMGGLLVMSLVLWASCERKFEWHEVTGYPLAG
jgi:hypothetical protein